MIFSIDAGVHSNAVRTELRTSTGINVQDCFWTPISGYRPGDDVPLITQQGTYTSCVRARWGEPGSSNITTSFESIRRALLPATMVRYQVPSKIVPSLMDQWGFCPGDREWFALACNVWKADDGRLSFRIRDYTADPERAHVQTLEPMVVPPPAWKAWLNPQAPSGYYPPRPGTVRLQPLAVW